MERLAELWIQIMNSNYGLQILAEHPVCVRHSAGIDVGYKEGIMHPPCSHGACNHMNK